MRTTKVVNSLVLTAVEHHLRSLSLINDNEVVAAVYEDDKTDEYLIDIAKE